MEAVSKIYLKLRYYFKLWRLNLDLKSVSEHAFLRSKGKSFHKLPWMPEVFSLANGEELQSEQCLSARDLWLRQLSLLSAPIQ